MVKVMSCGFYLLFFFKPQPNSKYKTSMCRDLRQQGGCPRGTNCTFAHSQEELEKWVWETFFFFLLFPPFNLNPSSLQRFLKTFPSIQSIIWKDWCLLAWQFFIWNWRYSKPMSADWFQFYFLFYPIWGKISFPAAESKLSVFQGLVISPTRDNINYILIDNGLSYSVVCILEAVFTQMHFQRTAQWVL